METTQTVKILGRFIVANPKVCHGQPTFRGTRIFVADVLEQVAEGMAWETIIEEWRGSITHEAVTEAIVLARQAFLEHSDEYILESKASRTSWMKTLSIASVTFCAAGDLQFAKLSPLTSRLTRKKQLQSGLLCGDGDSTGKEAAGNRAAPSRGA